MTRGNLTAFRYSLSNSPFHLAEGAVTFMAHFVPHFLASFVANYLMSTFLQGASTTLFGAASPEVSLIVPICASTQRFDTFIGEATPRDLQRSLLGSNGSSRYGIGEGDGPKDGCRAVVCERENYGRYSRRESSLTRGSCSRSWNSLVISMHSVFIALGPSVVAFTVVLGSHHLTKPE